MFYKEDSIRKFALEEASKQIRSADGRSAMAAHLPAILSDPVVKGALLAVLEELLAADRVKPLAEQVTAQIRDIVQTLDARFARVVKSESAKLNKAKSELIEKVKEELRLATIAQKSLATRQTNQHTKEMEENVSTILRNIERRLAEACDKAESAISGRRTDFLADLRIKAERVLEQKLHEFALDVVREHVRHKPISEPSLTNRQIAAANGISIREVKRRRRLDRLIHEGI